MSHSERMLPGHRLRLAPSDVFRLVVLLVLFALVLLVALTTDLFDELSPGGVHGWVRQAGIWAPAAYLLGCVVRPLTLIPLTLWLFAGGVAFGWLWGALYALVGVNLGAAGGFLTARALGREFVEKLLARRGRRLERLPRAWNARFVLSLQLIPFMPHDLLNVAAGCSTMSYWRFLAGSSLGTVPAVLLYTYAGSVLMAPGSKRFYGAFAALCALAAGSLLAYRWFRPEAAAGEEEQMAGPAGERGVETPAREPA